MSFENNKALPTVVIMTDNGPVLINESDYDPEVHALAEVDQVAPVKQEVKPLNAGIIVENDKYFVVNIDADNEVVGNKRGYATEDAARDAAVKLMNKG